MAQETYTAQMSQRAGRWRLYVVIYGETCWPEHHFAPGPAVPKLTERARALAALGYGPVGDEWEWTESSEDYEDPSSPVVLIAATTVEEVTSWTAVR